MLMGLTAPAIKTSVTRTPSAWLFDGKPFTSADINKAEGFVYRLTHRSTGKIYIGRKYFWSIRKTKGKKNRVRTESDWQSYMSSSKVVQEQATSEGPNAFLREIVSIHKTRGDTNFSEIKLQFLLNVLERDDTLNDAIGKYRRPQPHIIAARRHPSYLLTN
jgi:hypothetical protein